EGEVSALAKSLTDLVALELRRFEGLSVVSKDEVEAMIAFELDKQLIQCRSDVECIVEIGGALGVDYLVTGAVGKLGDSFVLTLKLLDIQNAEVKQRIAETFRGPERELGTMVRFAVFSLLGRPLEGNGELKLEADVSGVVASVDGGAPL